MPASPLASNVAVEAQRTRFASVEASLNETTSCGERPRTLIAIGSSSNETAGATVTPTRADAECPPPPHPPIPAAVPAATRIRAARRARTNPRHPRPLITDTCWPRIGTSQGIYPCDVALRALVVLLFVALTAIAALLGPPLLALVAGFVAAALIIDYLFPVTGFLRPDAEHAFQRLVWRRRREALGKRIRRRDYAHLELLPDELAGTANRRHLGIQPIPLDSITGTVEPERAIAFDGAFRPPRWSRGRWQLMWMACRRGQALPPISVYRLRGRHFVIDGHHRVSVARSLEAASIDADVTELLLSSANPRPARGSPGQKPPRPAIAHEAHAWLGWRPLLFFLSLGLGLTLVSGAFAPVPGYVLILVACALIGRGLGSPVHTGLTDHRQ